MSDLDILVAKFVAYAALFELIWRFLKFITPKQSENSQRKRRNKRKYKRKHGRKHKRH